MRLWISLCDIILCLKALKNGYRNLYTPHAALLHHEGASRGYQTPVEDILRGYEEMDEILRNGDPYFSPNLTLEPIPRCEMDSWKPGHRSQKYLERKNYYLAHRSKPEKEKWFCWRRIKDNDEDSNCSWCICVAGGAERFVLWMLKAFPEADLFTSVYLPDGTFPEYKNYSIKTFKLGRWVKTEKQFKVLLPLWLLLIRKLNLDNNDIVISS